MKLGDKNIRSELSEPEPGTPLCVPFSHGESKADVSLPQPNKNNTYI